MADRLDGREIYHWGIFKRYFTILLQTVMWNLRRIFLFWIVAIGVSTSFEVTLFVKNLFKCYSISTVLCYCVRSFREYLFQNKMKCISTVFSFEPNIVVYRMLIIESRLSHISNIIEYAISTGYRVFLCVPLPQSKAPFVLELYQLIIKNLICVIVLLMVYSVWIYIKFCWFSCGEYWKLMYILKKHKNLYISKTILLTS